MTTQSLARMTRSVKKIEKPRPLKISGNQNRHSTIDGRLGSLEDIMTLADSVSMHIVNGNYDGMLQMNILTLSNNLKLYGQQLEAIYKDQLDRAFATFRNGCRDERLDYISRIHLLEVIELRATNWQSCDNINLYYKQKISVELELLPVPDTPTLLAMSPTLLGPSASPLIPQPPMLSPGEVIKTSGKFAKPTKIPGKNYCKDEVVIRNSDSGKVMGIKGRRVHMIEELSETIISFQRVSPGAKERLVQITGPNENKINDAKHLIEDTIRRNASPVRLEQPERERMGGSSSSLNSSASDDSNRFPQAGVRRSALHHSFSTNDANLGEYKHTVTVGNDSLKLTGTNLELVKTAMLVLEDYFSGEREQYVGAGDFLSTYEEEPRTPSAVFAAPPPTKLALGSRVGSQDSGATSESEETYKATPEGHVETGDVGLLENSRLTLVRQPLCPGAPKEAFDKAEASVKAVDQGARNRRAFFAQTNSQPKDSSVIKAEVPTNPLPKRLVYSEKVLLDLSISEFSQAFPKDWDRISKDCPNIVKKSVDLFDPAAYIEKCRELGGATSVVSATEGNLSDAE